MTNVASQLTFSTSTLVDETTVHVSGEVDLESAPALREALLAVVTTTPGHVLVDLSGVTFMDSTGLHALMAAKRRADVAGVHLAVTNSSRVVERLLEITALSSVFQPQGSGTAAAPA